jgi:transcriptional regulator with XRE-family HTH domain
MAATGTLSGEVMAPRATSVTTPALHYWRTKRALLQRELAERAGVDLTTVQRLERGLSSRLHTVRKLAEVLGVDPADLMGQPPEA